MNSNAPSHPEDTAKHRKDIMVTYIFLILGFLMSFVPHSIIHLLGILLMLAGVFQSYGLKNYAKKGENSELTDNHSRFIIRTFWIGSLYLTIGIALAVILADHSPVYQMVDRIMLNPRYLTQDLLNALFLEYAKANWLVFLVTLGPGTVFFFYRLFYGLWKSYDGKTLPNCTAWY